MEHSPLASEHSTLPKDQDELVAGFGGSGEVLDRRGRGPWSVVFWADEKHVIKEVTRQIRDALGVNWAVAEKLAKEAEQVVSGVRFLLWLIVGRVAKS